MIIMCLQHRLAWLRAVLTAWYDHVECAAPTAVHTAPVFMASSARCSNDSYMYSLRYMLGSTNCMLAMSVFRCHSSNCGGGGGPGGGVICAVGSQVRWICRSSGVSFFVLAPG